MTLRIARFVDLVLRGLLAGKEFGTWAAVHRLLCAVRLPPQRGRGTFGGRAPEGLRGTPTVRNNNLPSWGSVPRWLAAPPDQTHPRTNSPAARANSIRAPSGGFSLPALLSASSSLSLLVHHLSDLALLPVAAPRSAAAEAEHAQSMRYQANTPT